MHRLLAIDVSTRMGKRPFNIHTVARRIRQEVKQFAHAAMFDLAAKGYASPAEWSNRTPLEG